jgi:polyferredoxin
MLQDLFTEDVEFSALEEVTTQFLSKSDTIFLIELGSLFLLLILISLFIKNSFVRKLRPLFLLSTLVYFGFYKGGCPCMIMSMENTLFLFLGKSIAWISIIWFLSLIPLTYFFGKIWCGWLCHLGALQESLFAGSRFRILTSLNAQTILRRIRLAVLILFIVQSAITMSYLWGHYDPFKSIYNLRTHNIAGFSLVIILLISSLFIYRPFCRAICPVGVVLGWIALIPGARKVAKGETCVNCKTCSNLCKTNAIVHENSKVTLNIQDCIMCGECFGSCKKNSLCIDNRR